jgi:hypothetical protein
MTFYLPETWSRTFSFLFSGRKDRRLYVLRRWDVVVVSCCESTGPSNLYFFRTEFSIAIFFLRLKNCRLYVWWGKMLLCCKFVKEFWRVFCLFGHKSWHFIWLYVLRRWDVVVSFCQTTFPSIFCLSVVNFPLQFYSTLKNGRILLFVIEDAINVFSLQRILTRFRFFGHNPWHFICLSTETVVFLFSFRGVRTFGFIFYGDCRGFLLCCISSYCIIMLY